MKFSAVHVLALALMGSFAAAQDCEYLLAEPPMEMMLSSMEKVVFVGVTPIITRFESDEPKLRMTRYTSSEPVMESVGRNLAVTLPACSLSEAPTSSPESSSSAMRGLSSVGMGISMYLGGASPLVSGLTAAFVAALPGANAQSEECENIVEIEIHGPVKVEGDEEVMAQNAALEEQVLDLQAQIDALTQQVADLQAENDSLFDQDEVDKEIYDFVANEIAFGDFVAATPEADQVLGRLSNNGAAASYDFAGAQLFAEYNPEAQFYLSNAGDDSLLRDMQGEGFQFPTNPNEPEDVTFTLTPPPQYNGLSDLIYMPIKQMAFLIQERQVTCVEVVQTFIDRLTEFDPYLGIVATPLYDRALEMAASHDQLLNDGTYLGALMCIPFGVKDHHQIFDDEPTMYGSIAHANNVQSVKSTMMQQLMSVGAIPIAKMQLGTYAWSSANAWGEAMSPYLNGPGCGSSAGSASGAALGALPFAVSEETSGSIACPASASLISGHIGSYGSLSRTGAGLLCSETDHLGFHSRYLSDYGIIFNYARTGDDPLDGDSVAQEFINPDEVDPSTLRVMIIEGEGEWVYNEEDDDWNWNNVVRQSYGKTAWHWPERVANIKSRLSAANVTFDSFSLDQANGLWSFNSSDPYFDCASPDIAVMMASGPWAQLQECEFCFQNSKWKTYTPTNIPVKTFRYIKYCMVEMGKKFLNDPVWDNYDVIIDTRSNAGGGYDLPGGSFEQWVRTAKTFVMDYYEALECATTGSNTIEGAFTVLTAKPFEDYKNFVIGSIIQDPADFLYPIDDAIKTTFEGRTRCPFSFYETYNNMLETCPPLNTDGAPPGPSLRGMDSACDPTSTRGHIPEEWANEPYVAPYDLDDKIPDRAIFKWDLYGPIACTAVCPFVQSFCDYKGIVCDERRLTEERRILKEREQQGKSVSTSQHDGRKLTAEDFAEIRRALKNEEEQGGMM